MPPVDHLSVVRECQMAGEDVPPAAGQCVVPRAERRDKQRNRRHEPDRRDREQHDVHGRARDEADEPLAERPGLREPRRLCLCRHQCAARR